MNNRPINFGPMNNGPAKVRPLLVSATQYLAAPRQHANVREVRSIHMESIHPGVTGRAPPEPLAVSPRQTCSLLNIGITRLYELLRDGELDSYLEGRARRITMESIKRRVARLLAASSATGTAPQRRCRSRLGKRADVEEVT
jgi:hypothetical protein